jgi:hypothetical protein
MLLAIVLLMPSGTAGKLQRNRAALSFSDSERIIDRLTPYRQT